MRYNESVQESPAARKENEMAYSTCPRCGGDSLVVDEQGKATARNALSRKDNETYVCSSCGTDEAMCDFAGVDNWPGYPGLLSVPSS